MNSKNMIDQTLSFIEHIRFLISNSVACTEELLLVTGILSLAQAKLIEFRDTNINKNEMDKEFMKILEACEHFTLLLQLAQRHVWPCISLSLDIEDMFDGIANFRKVILTSLQILNFNLEAELLPTDSQYKNGIEKDLSRMYSIFYQEKNDQVADEKQLILLKKQRECLLQLFDKYGVQRPSYVPKFTNDFNIIKSYKDWHYDVTKILPDQHPDNFVENDSCSASFLKTSSSEYPVIKVTFKDVDPDEDDEVKKSFEKHFMLLSCLSKYSLLEFLGGSFDNEVSCYYSFFGGGSIDKNNFNMLDADGLHQILRDSKTFASEIPYYVAKGINYLHNRGIIHGNLSPKTMFYNNTSRSIKIWNYVLSTTDNINENRAPPEYHEKKIYTMKSDVFQFGTLLYQIGTNLFPRNAYLKQPDLDNVNGRECFSPEMKKLILDCWKRDPSERPTFEEILKRFKTGELYYLGENLNVDKISMFYESERAKKFDTLRSTDGLEEFEQLLEQNDEIGAKDHFNIKNGKEISSFLYKIYFKKDGRSNVSQKAINETKHLDSFGFFQYIIPFFKIEDNKFRKDFVKHYIEVFKIGTPKEVFDLQDFIKRFLENGGADVIKEYLEAGGPNIEYAMSIYSSIEDYIDTDMEESLNIIIPPLIKAKKVEEVFTICANIDNKVAAKLLSRNIKEISPLFNDKELSQTISNLIEIYLENTETIDEISNISIKDVMSSGNISLLFQLMKSTYFLSSITNEDLKEIILTLASDDKDEEQKCCALLASLGLDSDFFEVISQFNEILDKIITINDQKLVSRFIARITKYSSACEYLLNKLEEGTEIYEPLRELREPFYLISMSRISIFNPTRAIKLPFLKTNLIRNLNEQNELEATLRVLGVLSFEKEFWADGEIPQSLINLLLESVTTPFETKILLSVISNIVLIEEVNKLFSTKSNINIILFIIENEGVISGLGMRILSRLELPAIEESNRRQIERIIEVSKRQLELGNEFGIEGSAEIINKLYEQSERETLKEFIKEEEIYHTIVESSRKEANPKIFIKLMKSIQKINPNHQPELTPLFSRIIMNSRGQLPTEFYELKTQIA
ncbi:hypothetical protein M9Y10_015044 [Tritrichomonas musculus]|uniref:Protein kinase domain-containing protein n=1 Tax=Tritrichomonas musculus TaxID=1915356 RepID=A0ABR2L4D6_9EUKA